MTSELLTRGLLVDDDPIFREHIGRMIGDAFRLDEATSGTDALALIELHDYQFALIDYKLPDISGLALIGRLGRLSDSAIMLTAQGDEGVAVEALKAGYADYAIKGQITAPQLAKAIENAIEKRVLKESLRLSESRLDAALSHAAVGAWEFIPDNSRMLVSPQFLNQLGRSGESHWIEFDFPKHVHPDDLTDVLGQLHRNVRGEQDSYSATFRMVHRDGSYRWIRSQGKLGTSQSGEPRVVGVNIDVTEQVISNAMLKEQQERLKLAVDGADLGTWDWNVNSSEVKCNARWFEMIGYRDKEFVPSYESWEGLMHPDDVPLVRQALGRHLSGETDSYHAEFRLMSKAGDWIWILGKGRVIQRDESGEAQRMCGTQLDITESKQSAELSLKLTNDLAQSNRRLQHVNEALEQSIIELKQLGYATSHELKTPVNAIKGYLQLLEEEYVDLLNTPGIEYVEGIQSACDRLQNQISSHIRYSSLDATQQPFEKLRLDKPFADAINLFQRPIRDHGFEIDVCELPEVTGDSSQLQLVFENLISNAIKYRSDEPLRLVVSADRQDETFQIRVSDNGVGIPERFHEKVFEMFGRLHPHDDIPGSGIGLAICRKIMINHGGSIRVESQDAPGTCFLMEFPQRVDVERQPVGESEWST